VNEFALRTPVVFVIFNRPDSTRLVFAEIARAKPSKLFVVSDGPRAGRAADIERIAEARAIARQVTWECQVYTDFADVNLGAGRRIASGLDWVFSQVEEAIILEDDCLPDGSFFQFCQELLDLYRYDQRISMVSGDNFQFGRRRSDDSYYFSKYGHIWGWATWRDRWVGKYDFEMAKWPAVRDANRIADLVGNKREAPYWKKIFERSYRGEFNAWDYQWVFTNWLEGRVSVVPSENLISNIGFNKEATHTKGASDLANMKRTSVKFPLRHPLGKIRSLEADDFDYRRCFGVPLLKRIRNKIIGSL
jgi:hypothetical protein